MRGLHRSSERCPAGASPHAGDVARKGKQGMEVGHAEVAVISNSLLAAVSRALGGIDIDDDPPLVLFQ